MRDFQETPRRASRDYSLFLIRNLGALNSKLLEQLHSELLKKSAFISLERLTKGYRIALTIYGPKNLLQPLQRELNLLELEDYTKKYSLGNLLVFEVFKKNQPVEGEVFTNLPKLEGDEQFWWQLILHPKTVQRKKIFSGQIRVGLILNSNREMADQFESLNGGNLLKVPRPYSQEQMRELLCNRTFNLAQSQKFEISEVLSLVG